MARPSHGGATWTPLRENYFATPLLSAKEKSYLVRKSCEAAQEVVERARSTGGPVQWRHVEKYQDVQIYAGQPRSAYGSQSQTADVMSMCGVTSVAASVKEIAALFDLSTTRSMKEFSLENRDLFFDSVVLYNLSPRTKEKPLHQVTAKWIAVKCPRGIEDRDFCYLECQDKFVDSNGRKGWVLCLHSIKLPGCDDLTREFGFVRGSFYHSGIIVVETDRPGYVDVIHMVQINFKKNARVAPSFMRDRVAFVAKIRTMMRDKRLNEQRYLSDLELVPKKYRSRCTVCQDSFTLLLLRKMNCRKCGEVVCGACSKEFDVKNAKFMETVKIRVCMQCFQLITTVPKSQIPMLEQSRSSTTMSFLGYYEDEQRASFMTQVPSSAAEMAETSGYRRTKIFLQSMQKQRSSSRMPSGPPRTTELVYGLHPPRSSQPLRPSQIGVFPSASSVLDPYNRDTISYAPPPQAPRSAASIFDRPLSSAASHSVARDYDHNRFSEYGHHYAAAGVQPQKSSIPNGNAQRSASRQQSHRHEYNTPLPMYGFNSTDFPPPGYPESLRGSESKERDSESSNSSIDIDADEDRGSEAKQPMHEYNGDRSRANSRLTPVAPPLYYSDDIDRRSDHGTAFSVQPSYYSDDTGAQPSRNATPPTPPSYYSDDIVESEYNDMDGIESEEGPAGSGDEADSSDLVAVRKIPARSGQAGVMSFREEEETKAQECSDTPVFPPPSPSAYIATQEVLGRDSSVYSSSFRQGHSEAEKKVDEPPQGERLSEEHGSRESEHKYDLRDSELGLNTTVCDMSFLDSDMRQFHDQSLFMTNGRPTFDNGVSEQDAFLGSQQSQQKFSEGSITGARSSVGGAPSLRRPSFDTGFQVARPFLNATPHVTSPTNSFDGKPSLYGKPRGSRRASRSASSQQHHPHQFQRSETFALFNGDTDRPGSFSSAGSSSSNVTGSAVFGYNGDKDNASQQRSNARPTSSANGTSLNSNSVKSSGSSDASSHGKEETSENEPSSFFGALPEYIPPRFQHPQSMSGFSATSTYEVPERTEEETKELMRKLSSPGLHYQDSEPEHESKVNRPPWFGDDDEEDNSDSEFGAFDESIVHAHPQSNASRARSESETEEDEEEEEEEEDALLSARSLYKTFGNTLKITSLVGGGGQNNASLQRTFSKIQESIDMLSDDDSNDEESGDRRKTTR